MDMISKVEAARIVRNQRRLEMMEFDSFFFRALVRSRAKPNPAPPPARPDGPRQLRPEHGL